jgi:hypothetical protein
MFHGHPTKSYTQNIQNRLKNKDVTMYVKLRGLRFSKKFPHARINFLFAFFLPHLSLAHLFLFSVQQQLHDKSAEHNYIGPFSNRDNYQL